MESKSGVTYKGFLFKSQVVALKKLKGEAALRVLEERFGPLDFNGFKDYPAEDAIRMQTIIGEILYGKMNDENWCKIGELIFNTFAYSEVGKTTLKLFGKLENNIPRLPNILQTISKGFTCAVEKIGENQYDISITGEPHNPGHYNGIFLGAIRYFGFEPTVTVTVRDTTQVFHVTWK